MGDDAGLSVVGDFVNADGFAIVGRGVGMDDGFPIIGRGVGTCDTMPDFAGLGVPPIGCLPFPDIVPFCMRFPVASIPFLLSLAFRSPPRTVPVVEIL